MILISGKLKLHPRVAMDDFKDLDGIYSLSNGDLRKGVKKIKGVMKATLDGVYIPYGVSGFYYGLSEDVGIKVFYSLRLFKNMANRIKCEYTNIRKYYKWGFSVEPLGIENVHLNISINKKKINIKVKGIKTRRVNVPPAIQDFSVGKYYDFDCLDSKEHPLHNPKGYKAFRKSVVDVVKKNNLRKIPTKLGDIIYCMTNKRWYLVDCGIIPRKGLHK